LNKKHKYKFRERKKKTCWKLKLVLVIQRENWNNYSDEGLKALGMSSFKLVLKYGLKNIIIIKFLKIVTVLFLLLPSVLNLPQLQLAISIKF
jgi:hypothetical protein